jgi:hypothetical protein
VWNSTDRGAHWNHLHAPLPTGHFVGKVVPIGAAAAWLVSMRFPRPEDSYGQGLLYRTDSGGRHWADVGPTQSGQ